MSSIASKLKRKLNESNALENETKKCPEDKTVLSTTVKSTKISTGLKLPTDFYNNSCENLAKALLGKIIVRLLDDGTRLSGKIVETESYPGGVDKASHSFNGRKTGRNAPMFMDPGTAYVYFIYGTYYCFNISSAGEGAAVLLRSLIPLDGKDKMYEFRQARRKESSKKLKEHELCNGPSKLCQALHIDKKTINCENLINSQVIWIEKTDESDQNCPLTIVESKRIGIESAGEEWSSKLLRYYVKDCKCISVRDKLAEAKLNGDPN